jgi:hypothetical protein
MSSSVIANGKLTRIPGVYGTVDASALAGKGVSTGNMAVVGSFPSIERNVPKVFTSPQVMAAFDPTDLDLLRVAGLAFNPANDDQVTGAASVTIVNVQTNTQASFTFLDIAGGSSLVFKSKLWGQKGNRTYAKLVANTTDPKGLDVTIVRDGVSEPYSNLQSGPVFEACYTGAELTTSLLSVSPTAWTWTFTKAMSALPGAGPNTSVYTPLNFLISGKLTVTLSAVAPAEGITVTAVGISATGIPKTLSRVFAVGVAGPLAIQDTGVDALWSSITSVTVTTTNAASVIVATLSGNAIVLDPANFSYVGEMVSLINNNAAKGFTCTAKSPRINAIPAAQIDAQASVNVVSAAKLTARADLWAIVQGLAGSTLVDVTRATGATLPPKHYNVSPDTAEEVMLLGGSQTDPVVASTAYAAGLLAIETYDVQIVAVLSSDIEAAKALRAHCISSAIAGHERNGYYGTAASLTLDAIYAATAPYLNSRHVSILAEEIQVMGPLGSLEWLAPMYQAVQAAGIQAGTPVGTPSTNKRPNVYDVRAAWTPGTFANDNDAIAKGIFVYTKDNLGWKVLRSITSYLTDDNPAFCEVSTNESVNTSIRRLRESLASKIGSALTAVTANQLIGAITGELTAQVRDGVIKAFRNVNIVDMGDKYRIDYDVAAVEPFNFAEVTAHVYRT